MARILNIETTGEICSVALAQSGHTLAYREVLEPRAHSSMLTTLIYHCLRDGQLQAADLNAIALCSGPGSYTGIRIGAATASAFCFALAVPLIAVNALHVMASILLPKTGSSSVVVGFKARVGEYYVSAYDSQLACIVKPQIMTEEQVLAALSTIQKPVTISSQLPAAGADVDSAEVVLNANGMVGLTTGFFDGGKFTDPVRFKPDYLKPVYLGQ